MKMSLFSEKTVNLFKVFDYYDPRDIAVAFVQVASLKYGSDSFQCVRKFEFKIIPYDLPINFLKIETGIKTTANGVFGQVKLQNKSFSGEFDICSSDQPVSSCQVKASLQAEADDFLDAIGKHLKEKSIYRGKAISIDYEFLDLSGISETDVVYNENTKKEIQTNIWTMIENPERCGRLKILRQRKVLLLGTYGSGKTLTALLTAKKASAKGWTFIYVPPTNYQEKNNILFAFELAKKYWPAIIFIEDIDQEQYSNFDESFLKKILESTDGIISKNGELILILTANRTEKIAPALQRPGRIDKIIHMGLLNHKEIKSLLAAIIPEKHLDQKINWEELGNVCGSYPPAFIREIGTSSLLKMISENGYLITQENLIAAAKNLECQFRVCDNPLGFKK